MSKPFIVLGMHRSATSLVAGGLHKFGVDMGRRQLGRTKSNRKGHFEDKDFLELNIEILNANGGTWRNPPDTINPHLLGRAAQELVEAKMDTGNELWGWKDPRTALTYPIYEPHLGPDAHLVCVFRRPANVARSLESRNNIPIPQAAALADTYNRAILEAAAKHVGLDITIH